MGTDIQKKNASTPQFFLENSYESSRINSIHSSRNFVTRIFDFMRIQEPSYLAPNELHPLNAKEIISSTPSGVYLGVGTERCLMAAAMNNQFSHVIMADYDPDVIFFNKTNVALLKASPNRTIYNKLRFCNDFNQFNSILKKNNYQCQSSGTNLYDKNIFKKFANFVSTDGFSSYHNASSHFKEASYLHNDDAFQQTKKLADENKIFVIKYDAGSRNDINRLNEALQKSNLKISLYDLSNAWWPGYVTLKNSPDRSFILGPSLFASNGIIMLTDRRPDFNYYYIGFKQVELSHLEETSSKIFKKLFTEHQCLLSNITKYINKTSIENKIVDFHHYLKIQKNEHSNNDTHNITAFLRQK